ncbi:MAG TPA: hypothetical protein VFG04_08455 [Planctomycetaceae bacterium]|jgi:hypothetical protein|nr:hypothetical protein [Planctomycetaceae bacterium]
MNDSDDFADLERRLVADANRLQERTVEFVDSNKLVCEARARRTRRLSGGAVALILVALTTATVTRTWTDNPRSAVVSHLDQTPARIVPNAALPHVLTQTQKQAPTHPVATDANVVTAKVVIAKIDASPASTSANTALRPIEFVVTVPDGEGRRAIGRIYWFPVRKNQLPTTGQSQSPVYRLTTRRRVNFDELSFVQQDAVRRLLGMEQPVAASVTF